MPKNKNLIATTMAMTLTAPAAANADEINFQFYGSARVHAESVRPDDTSVLDAYTGIRDAYSRIGFKADYALGGTMELFGQLELPLDLANKAVQDPWDQDQDIRVAQIGLRGDFGSVSYGQMWMPYYNAIAYPVDMFSSYYSGFATYTAFRRGDTVAYYSPGFRGFYFGAGWSDSNGADGDDRIQVTGSYTYGRTTVSVGMDDLGGEFNSRIYGISMLRTMGNLYIGAKYEVHDSRITSGYGADGDRAVNLYGGYTAGKNTFKLMLANVENYGENIVHLGVDHQLLPRMKLFAEYYYEEDTAALTEKRGGLAETAWTAGGGQVLAAGARFDF
ncbi:porin [Thioalkalivibrio thiocyanodenitrificans]|uniref:porin n=1 Tax=Thioalkalivibrio thiocyanodenitrificans TaxID=243063 RepID=UPI0003818043|nr:porin [Thioalkalivibrio thiocyanodenitrificans]